MDLNEYFQREPIAERGISVVMPARNEADCLEAAVASVSSALDRLGRGHEIIIVDDGSNDATAEIAQRLAAANRRVRVVGHSSHLGYGVALRSGIEAAKYPLLLQMESDNQYVATEIERLLSAIDETDVVCGYREVRQSAPGSRLVDWFYRRLVRVVFAVRVRDVNCGFRLYRRAAVRRIPIQSTGRFANAEILAKANFMNMLVAEVPVTHQPRTCGIEKRPRESFMQTLREAARVFWRPQFAPVPSDHGRATSAAHAA